MKFEKGIEIKFKASTANNAPVTIQSRKKLVTVKRNGEPVKAADLVAGKSYKINKFSGEIL